MAIAGLAGSWQTDPEVILPPSLWSTYCGARAVLIEVESRISTFGHVTLIVCGRCFNLRFCAGFNPEAYLGALIRLATPLSPRACD